MLAVGGDVFDWCLWRSAVISHSTCKYFEGPPPWYYLYPMKDDIQGCEVQWINIIYIDPWKDRNQRSLIDERGWE